MTARYDAQRDAFGRRAQWLVEIDLDTCANTYTSAPCTAADQGDGLRCWYTYQTCQDASNFNRSTTTLRFCLNDVPWPDPAVQVRPLLREIVGVPQEISADTLVTYPERITLKFAADWAPPPINHGRGSGKYNTARIGEFWRNLRARNPNYSGRTVRIYRGFYSSGFLLSDFAQIGAPYVLKLFAISGDTCELTIESPLVKLNDKQTPWATSDTNILTTALTAVSGSDTVHVTDASEFPDPTTLTHSYCYAQIEDEIVRVTARSTGANTLTVTRGQAGTTAAAHAITDGSGNAVSVPVSNLVIIGTDNTTAKPTGCTVTTALRQLLELAGVADAAIDAASFTTLSTQFWATNDILWVISKPRRISELVSAIREPRGILLYISAAGLFSAKVMAPGTALKTLTDASFVAKQSGVSTLEMVEDDESRITRASIWYDPVQEGKSGSSGGYNRGLVYIDSDMESANNYGSSKEQTLTDAGLSPDISPIRAANLARRLITRKRAGIRTFTGTVELKDAQLDIGDGVVISTGICLGLTGVADPRPCIVTARKEVGRGQTQFKFTDTNFGGRFLRIGPDTIGDTYATMTADERSQYSAWGDANNRVGAQKEPGYVVW